MARTTRLRWQTLGLSQLVADVCRSLDAPMSVQGVDVTIDVPPQQSITADGDMLRQAVANLVVRALDTMPRGGSLVITSSVSGDAVELEVADSGPGLPAETRRRDSGEPFLAAAETVDFGLAVVCRIAELHGGRLTAINCPEGGSAFTLSIPRTVAAEKAA